MLAVLRFVFRQQVGFENQLFLGTSGYSFWVAFAGFEALIIWRDFQHGRLLPSGFWSGGVGLFVRWRVGQLALRFQGRFSGRGLWLAGKLIIFGGFSSRLGFFILRSAGCGLGAF